MQQMPIFRQILHQRNKKVPPYRMRLVPEKTRACKHARWMRKIFGANAPMHAPTRTLPSAKRPFNWNFRNPKFFGGQQNWRRRQQNTVKTATSVNERTRGSGANTLRKNCISAPSATVWSCAKTPATIGRKNSATTTCRKRDSTISKRISAVFWIGFLKYKNWARRKATDSKN